jgi:hypothetical protein
VVNVLAHLPSGVLLPLPLAVANRGSDQHADQANHGGQGDFGEFIHKDNLHYRLCSDHTGMARHQAHNSMKLCILPQHPRAEGGQVEPVLGGFYSSIELSPK